MTNLTELYQEIIIEHNRSPRNFRTLPDANRSAEGDNPLCGDRINLQLRVEGGVIQEIGFQGSGCAISRASASLMTTAVQGRTTAEAGKLFEAFHGMVTDHPEAPVDTGKLGKLAALAGVRRFPGRVKCATMAWHTLQEALDGK